MANTGKCEWCNRPDASSWEREVDGKKYSSKEKFCSRKCMEEYSDRYPIEWSKKSNTFLIVIVVIIIIYILGQK